MKDPNDTRDIGPRPGSPLWITSDRGLGGRASRCCAWPWRSLPAAGRPLVSSPLLWTIAVLIVVGELRPIITPGEGPARTPPSPP